jgi:sterol desaturase/sphingolipid hydroxylase (fatty acid hydroxylase superfamily)
MSTQYKFDRGEEPIRLFKSNFMEFFTHIHPAIVALIWLPIILYFFISAIIDHVPGTSWAYIPLGFVAGLLVWTFMEYSLHRFLFHFKPKSPLQERISFLFHGVHHAQPQCKTRLVMPPAVSIPMGLAFYGLFYLVLNVLLGKPLWVAPVFSAALLGYLTYDLTHYATHHFRMRSGYLKFLKRYHMAHHFRDWNAGFGVTSPVWDKVFHTELKNLR